MFFRLKPLKIAATLRSTRPKSLTRSSGFWKTLWIRPIASGLNKPEASKDGLSGLWSHRINREYRSVYKVDGDVIYIVSCRYH
ncbi:Txe/YoeB family addiction module toxin [Deltaproteobacteria bacterium Smac51]|nr:Txe/YoeB family addiction module toxin [Deltaproteobacteria bacterium Smac51]